MIWGHAPLGDETKESYDLWQYHESHDAPLHLKKIRIPSNAKRSILNELHKVYGIKSDTIYLSNGYLETEFGSKFEALKEEARLKTLYMTDADRLSPEEERAARSYFRIDCRNMIGECVSITRM